MRCILMTVSNLTFCLFFVIIQIQLTLSQTDYRVQNLNYASLVRHPGTCTFQKSQQACTFNLLCYVAGGVPLEGCGGDISSTCCMLYSSPNQDVRSNYRSHHRHKNRHHHQHHRPIDHTFLSHSAVLNSHHSLSSPSSYYTHYEMPHINDYNYRNVRRAHPVSYASDKPPRQSRNHIRDDYCGKTVAKPINRIIGGQDAYFGEFPWQVHIKISKHQCGGALVNHNYVVTAAHCVYQAPLSQLTVIVGAHDIEDHRYQEEPPEYFRVKEVRMHPKFRFSASHPDRYDIAVLRLDRSVKYSSNIIPVCLPPNGYLFENWYGVVTGWGKTDPALSNRYGTRLLQKVDVPIIDNDECEKWHRTRGIDLKIFPEMMCAGYEDGQKDACVGDSGGPMVIFLNGRWTLAGITSAGFGCAQSRQPGIYHRVSHTVDWILSNIH